MIKIKCLTVRQPWSHAIIHGSKRIENRTWTTAYRGPLAIHAGLKRIEAVERRAVEEIDGPLDDSLVQYGGIIGVVDLVEIRPVEEASDDPWAIGPWCWILANPRHLPYRPMRGQLSLFDVLVELEAA